MIKRLIMQSFIWFIIVGSIAYGMAFILGDATPTILRPRVIDYGNGITLTMYSLDIHAYLNNLQNSINIPFKNMYINFPTPWKASNWDAINVAKILYNALIWVVNVVLWIANITIIIPTKLIMHPIVLIMGILGIDTTNLGIVEAANFLYSLNIPFIPYW